MKNLYYRIIKWVNKNNCMKNNKSKQDEMKSKKTLSENQNKYLKRIIPNDLHSNPNLLTDHPELNVLKAIIEGKISNKDNSQAKSCKHNFLFCWICSLLNIFKPSSHKNIVYKNTFSIGIFF